MVSRRKRRARELDPLAACRKIREPMAPPEKVMRDRRRELDDEQARREMDVPAEGEDAQPREPER